MAKRCYLYHGINTHHIYRPDGIIVKFSRPRGNYRGYRGITALPVTVSSSKSHVEDVGDGARGCYLPSRL